MLQVVAENTGGRAVVNNNDMDREVPALLDETSSFYLLGVDAGPAKDGSFRPIRVRVNRPDVDVRTRNGIYTMTAKEREKASAGATSADARLATVIDSLFPKSDVPLDISVATFLARGTNPQPLLAVSLNVHPDPSDFGIATEQFEAVAAVFASEDAKGVGERRQSVNVRWPAHRRADEGFELLSRMPIKPGRYELHVAVESATGRTGSVQTFADVPDFPSEPLALSGFVLLSPGPGMRAPAGEFAELLPAPITSRPAFKADATVTAFLRIYQLGARTPVAATVHLRLLDGANVERLTRDVPLPPGTFDPPGSADFSFDVPLASLDPGEYLLVADVSAGGRTQQRTLRFSRR